MIPNHDENGLLPAGIHPATLAEIRARFGWTEKRLVLLAGLEAWLREWRDVNAAGYAVLVDGSFVRRKDEPGDVDVILLLPEDVSHDIAMRFAFLCHLRRAEMKARYHVEAMVWYRHAQLDVRAFFAYIGEKAAAELDLDPHHPKGYLRLTP